VDFKPPMGQVHAEAVKPVPLTMATMSRVDRVSSVRTTPESVWCEILTSMTPVVAFRTFATRSEQPSHVIPVMANI